MQVRQTLIKRNTMDFTTVLNIMWWVPRVSGLEAFQLDSHRSKQHHAPLRQPPVLDTP